MIRVRFAPSPTGALHIGGVRTALYNYLLAKQQGGTFILRIEDTDQTRYVPGAEDYIIEALQWCGLTPDEGPGIGGDYGPYRQSERKALYAKYAQQLVENGQAYYAFDTPEALNERREAEKAKGNHSFKYDAKVRGEMDNSLNLDTTILQQRLASEPYVIRLKVPQDTQIFIEDIVRGTVTFDSNELDDKVMLKADGMPTYHLANIVDDHLMEITHVIRGEEWLSSTAHHVLLYKAFGWEMPQFAHLPLILKPTGKGKLSKRDGTKLGIPVFPLGWQGTTEADTFKGFKDYGFDPQAVINFLAFLGWNPGTAQEIFDKKELIEAFSLEKISKSGARFDYDKAKWFNQQYIIATDNTDLAKIIQPILAEKGYNSINETQLAAFCGLFKERVENYNDFLTQGYYCFEPVHTYDEKTIKKRWKPENRPIFNQLYDAIKNISNFDAPTVETTVKEFINDNNLKFGQVLPILRIALSGTMKGPDVFQLAAFLGQDTVLERLKGGYDRFDKQVV